MLNPAKSGTSTAFLTTSYELLPMNRSIYLYTLIIFFLHVVPFSSSQADTFVEMGKITYRVDYLLHTAVFIPWMLLPCLTVTKRRSVRSIANRQNIQIKNVGTGYFLSWLGLGIVFAALMEGLHYVLPYRTFNPVDALFNIAGVGSGALLALIAISAAKATGRA